MARRRTRSQSSTSLNALSPLFEGLVRSWILRIITRPEGFKSFTYMHGFHDDGLAEYLGQETSFPHGEFDVSAARRKLQALHQRTESKGYEIPNRGALSRNLRWLSSAAGLSELEIEILCFRVLAGCHPYLEKALDLFGSLTMAAVQQLLATALKRPLDRIQGTLKPDSRLITSGILRFDQNRSYTFNNKLELLPNLADQLCLPHRDTSRIFISNFTASPKAQLEPNDYPHLKKDWPLLEAFLGEAMAKGQKGINVLVHGSPGTGKTEFGRMMAARLGSNLYEIATQGGYGEPLQGDSRFRAFQLAQEVLRGQRNHIILFDEVEDVFRISDRDDDPWNRGNRTGMKGWINRLLETNQVPAIWITNAIDSIDSAFRRRFDFVLEVGVPPRSVRGKILERYLEGLPISEQVKTNLAEHPALSPAVVERAAKVVRAALHSGSMLDADTALTRSVGNTLEALGYPRQVQSPCNFETEYRPDLLHTDCSLTEVRQGLTATGQARLCFYGPPGTGKSAFARHLSEVLDRPLIIRRASNLLSPYLGVTERLMSRMFNEARDEGAVLLLDEADSFLRDRTQARNSWEVTQVNEMLTQMESYQGIFIASTNLLDSLDAASLRRFDARIHFGFLRAEQAWEMFCQTAQQLHVPVDPGVSSAVRALGLVTPGDFATLVRQARVRPITDSADLLTRLRGECEAKEGGRRRAIGF